MLPAKLWWRCSMMPASRRTLKWWLQVDFVTGRSKLPQVCSPVDAASEATIRSRIGSLSACSTDARSSSERGRVSMVTELIVRRISNFCYGSMIIVQGPEETE